VKIKLRQRKNGITLECRISPRAGQNAIRGVRDGALSIALNAPPIEGRANKALIEFISRLLHVPRSHIEIIKGQRGRQKTLFIQDVSKDSVMKNIQDVIVS